MTTRYWALDGHKAVPGATIEEWDSTLSDEAAKTVGRTEVGDWFVSTVFLGVDQNYGGGPLLLFETMIFSHHEPRLEADESCWRYTTWEEAEAGHAVVVRWLTADPGANEPGPPEFGSEHE